jgi:ATP-dependent Lhr-like helicase
LQRLHAADLLQIVKDFKDFPIIMETYRDCLEDVFDLHALNQVLEKINKGEIAIRTVDTPYPSPMASGLVFRFMAENMYQYDPVRAPAQAVEVSSDLLAEIMVSERIPTLITAQQVEEAVKRWQYLTPETQARDQEDLYEIIAKLGPILHQDLQNRAKSDITVWLQNLLNSKRIEDYSGDIGRGYITAEDFLLFSSGQSEQILPVLMRRLFVSQGPLTMNEINSRLGVSENEIKSVLDVLLSNKEIVKGQLVADNDEVQYCDRQHFAQLYRHAVAVRRENKVAAERDTFYRFLLQWHQVGDTEFSAVEILKRYSGYSFAPFMLEQNIFPSRSHDASSIQARLCDSILTGEIIIRTVPVVGSDAISITFFERGQGNIFIDKAGLQFPEEENFIKIFHFLKENGASLFQDIVDGAGLKPGQVDEGLADLCRKGLVSCNDYHAFLMMILERKVDSPKGRPLWRDEDNSLLQTINSRRSSRRIASEKLARHRGYWFLIDSFAVMGKPLNETQRAEKQTRLLLQRHGILVKEWYRHEQGFMPWYQIFQVLKKLEWQGEIRRGYFVKGLSGLQFATAEAVELLEKMHDPEKYKNKNVIVLSTADPALPFGGQVPWDIVDITGARLAIVRSAANHLFFFHGKPAMYSENWAARLWRCAEFSNDLIIGLPSLIKDWLRLSPDVRPRRKIVISSIDGQSALQSPLAAEFLKCGFEKDGERLVLWPSGV